MNWSRVEFSKSEYLHFTRSTDQKMVEACWLANYVRSLYENENSLDRPFEILDIGTGDGNFISEFLSRLCKLRKESLNRFVSFNLIEPEKKLIPILEKICYRLQGSFPCDLSINAITVDEWLKKKNQEGFDLIMFIHVLYYFDSVNFRQIIQKCLERLRPKGIICLVVCHTDSWLADLRKRLVDINPACALHPFLTHRPVLEFLTEMGISWRCFDVFSHFFIEGILDDDKIISRRWSITFEEVLAFLLKIRVNLLRKMIPNHYVNDLIDPLRLSGKIDLQDAFIFIESKNEKMCTAPNSMTPVTLK